jgi:hypothetical protein
MPPAPQVANSFIGRYFKLEGSGVTNERLNSRFFVRIWSASTLVAHLLWPFRQRSVQDSLHGYVYLMTLRRLTLLTTLTQAAMAYIVRPLSYMILAVVATLTNIIVLVDFCQRLYSF